MLRFVLLLAAGCVALLVVLALLRDRGEPAGRPRPVEAAVVAEEPAPAPVAATPQPEPAPPAAAEAPAEPDDQVAEDAAAVGMTTVEPPAEAPPSDPPG